MTTPFVMEADSLSTIQLAARRAFVAQGLSSIAEVLARLRDVEANSEGVFDLCARLLHTIKGGAGFVGHRHIAEFATVLERQIHLSARETGSVPLPKIADNLERLAALLREVEERQEIPRDSE